VGTRNIRISRRQVAERLSEIDGREVHIVLRDGRTFFGKVVSVSPAQISIRDVNARWTSLKRHTHALSLDDIIEVILDTVTDY
jgi:small nuclear ribonucleoprotein (snRNP)-like protein